MELIIIMIRNANMMMQYMELSRHDMDQNGVLHASIGFTVENTQGSKVSTLYKQQCTNSRVATSDEDTIIMQKINMACECIGLK